jgi:hypothetical protein
MGTVWTVVGFALFPFILALVAASTHTVGARKIFWAYDILALIVAAAAFMLVRDTLAATLLEGHGAITVLGSTMMALGSMWILYPLTYRVIYSCVKA